MTNKITEQINNTKKIAHAFQIAFNAHRDEKGEPTYDDNGENYVISHCMNVLNILKLVTNDIDILCAGILHDTIEDTKITYSDLVKEMGVEVANLVYEVTKEQKEDGGHFPRLKSEKAIILKFADRLSNLSRMQAWDAKKKQWYLNKSKFWKE